MHTVKEKQNKVFESLQKSFSYKNLMQSPRISKIVVSVGMGSVKDKKKIELIADRLMKITGQKPAVRGAKKSISSFKVREGDPVGYQVTLRGPKMYGFLDKLLSVALPRTRDFRGIPVTAVDNMGNYTIGVKEHTIFPETTDEDIKDVFGLGITIVTTSKTKEETKAFLEHLGFPFKKVDAKK
jgi:large subunit ribosomal protein L5